jgi:UDP-N-acetylmuramate dehydrogenase
MTIQGAPPSPREVDAVAAALREVLSDSVLRTDENVGALTTYRVGGRARLFVEVESSADLAALIAVTGQLSLPVAILGRGSNLLISDRGFAGLVVRLGEPFVEIEDLGSARVRVGGATSLPVAARRTAALGLTGFEWAVGVPGSVGGAVRMNAGGHGSDMAASVVSARVVDLARATVLDLGPDALEFGYRASAIAASQLVVSAELQLAEGDPASAEVLLSDIVRWRRENQPGGQNAGSVFTNPPGDSAGRLIDAAGLKGFRIGSAEVSEKHANFIQVDPDGLASDVVALMAAVIDSVEAETGIGLRVETRLLGFHTDVTKTMFDPRGSR